MTSIRLSLVFPLSLIRYPSVSGVASHILKRSISLRLAPLSYISEISARSLELRQALIIPITSWGVTKRSILIFVFVLTSPMLLLNAGLLMRFRNVLRTPHLAFRVLCGSSETAFRTMCSSLAGDSLLYAGWILAS